MSAALADRPTLNPLLRDFWRAPARNRVLFGGRASTKSWDAAGFATFLTDNYKLRFCCARQFQNRIEDSVYSLLKTQIDRFGLGRRFSVLAKKILHRATKSEFLFYGLWRDIGEIKSLEGVDVLWIEEAHSLTEEQWKTLEPTIRKEHSQIWIVFNPKLATDFAYKRFVVNPPPNTVVRRINYDENPFLSKTMRAIIQALKDEDYDEYLHIYEGVPKDNDDSAIIKRAHLMAAIDAHKALGFEASGRRRLGFDVADSGDDLCATVEGYGSIVTWSDEWKGGEDELLKSCTRVYRAARERGADITYDSIGVGASAGAKFGELNAAAVPARPIHYAKFNAGGAVWMPEARYGNTQTKNRDMFANLKAQAWWLVADRYRNTFAAIRNGDHFEPDQLISLSSDLPHIDKLIEELATPKKDYDNNGRVKVESKKDLANPKRDGGPVPSPNLADAHIMAFAPEAPPMKINPALLGVA